ncbi:hypothetical protein [Dyadobacter bucti]|uniref:hypothetical protein n=1 Tax=Dyadobacter bucti TaxID=2572203 RepID=UPI003F6ED42D
MNRFIKYLVLFVIIGVVIGELLLRVLHLTNDVPLRTIGKDNIQKYVPVQHGYWNRGGHQWQINKLGWAGRLPKQYHNLITIIGDSYIENFMNPDDCHQGVLLKELLPEHNFLEAGRSGVSFIEAMEIAKSIDSLNPVVHLLYMNSSDFTESIKSVKPMTDIAQLDLKTGKIVPGEMKFAFAKRVLYSCKFAYYLFNRFSQPKPTRNTGVPKRNLDFGKIEMELKQLFHFTSVNYDVGNKVLVFHPGTDNLIIELARDTGFKVIVLNSSKEKSWTFEYDPHWNCYGNERVASQVSKGLTVFFNGKKAIVEN